MQKITVTAVINAAKDKVWDFYTNPGHITKWNFADPSWHCPAAQNDLRVGGSYVARMEAKDGSVGFNFEAMYTKITPGEMLSYEFGDRHATVSFANVDDETRVTIVFDPETDNPIALQQAGWQSILNNFKQYVEMY